MLTVSSLSLGLDSVHLFRFIMLCFFLFSLHYFVLVLFAFVVLDLVSTALRQEISREERLRNDLVVSSGTYSYNFNSWCIPLVISGSSLANECAQSVNQSINQSVSSSTSSSIYTH